MPGYAVQRPPPFHTRRHIGAITIRPEKKRQGWYWYAYHAVQGSLHKSYLGKAEAITPERLQAVASTLMQRTGTADGSLGMRMGFLGPSHLARDGQAITLTSMKAIDLLAYLAAHFPERIDRLALCNTAARMGPPQLWDARIESVRQWGMASIVGAVMARWFTQPFWEREPEVVEPMRQALIHTPADGYIACCEAIRDMDQRAILSRIRATTLVIAGALDAASPPAEGRFLAETIPDARYLEFRAAHMTNIEIGQPFTDALVRFFTE